MYINWKYHTIAMKVDPLLVFKCLHQTVAIVTLLKRLLELIKSFFFNDNLIDDYATLISSLWFELLNVIQWVFFRFLSSITL